MHNENEVHIPVETDMFPYYKWEDVERFYRNLLNLRFFEVNNIETIMGVRRWDIGAHFFAKNRYFAVISVIF